MSGFRALFAVPKAVGEVEKESECKPDNEAVERVDRQIYGQVSVDEHGKKRQEGQKGHLHKRNLEKKVTESK